MLGMIPELREPLEATGWTLRCPEVVQVMSEAELTELLPQCDGWIIGDDPATRRVFEAGKKGRFKAAVKWGVGVDNVDFVAAKDLGVPITNTPGAFGSEVADVAMAYVTCLARHLVCIDRDVRGGDWPKPRGISLAGRTMALVGFGDIGRNVAKRATAAGMQVIAYDPALSEDPGIDGVTVARWPERLGAADFIVLTCALNDGNRHMVDEHALTLAREGVRIVNVARGPLIDTAALVTGLDSGRVHSAALDVLETEPLGANSPLRAFEQCVFGSHNASNTEDAVRATSLRAIEILMGYLGKN